MMKPQIIRADSLRELLTPERCYLYENWGISTNDSKVSIARARVEPGVTTKAHHLEGTQEIYIIVEGIGEVKVGDLKPSKVSVGDVVTVPAGTSQKMANTGKTNLVFYCICTPAFKEECYHNDEDAL